MSGKGCLNTVSLDVRFVKVLLEKLYDSTKAEDLFVMISRASAIRDNEVKESLSCLKKLIQLNASGYLDPPINFEEMLDEIVLKKQNKEVKDDT